MNRNSLANRLQYIPLLHVYSLWHFTRNHNFFDTIAVGLVAAILTLLFGNILPFVPDSIKKIYNCLSFYVITLCMVIAAKHLQARHDSKRKSPK